MIKDKMREKLVEATDSKRDSRNIKPEMQLTLFSFWNPAKRDESLTVNTER